MNHYRLGALLALAVGLAGTAAACGGGKATITATYRGASATASVTVNVHVTQIGDPEAPDGGIGLGGAGGVGGEGEGLAATNAQVALLNGPVTADGALGFLYPYDKTV